MWKIGSLKGVTILRGLASDLLVGGGAESISRCKSVMKNLTAQDTYDRGRAPIRY